MKARYAVGVAGVVAALVSAVLFLRPPATPTTSRDTKATVRVGSILVTPRKIHDVAPIYSASIRGSGVSGIVVAELSVAANGTVRTAAILRGVSADVDRAVIDAVKQWRYEPVLLDGKPVPVVLTASVPIVLN